MKDGLKQSGDNIILNNYVFPFLTHLTTVMAFQNILVRFREYSVISFWFIFARASCYLCSVVMKIYKLFPENC